MNSIKCMPRSVHRLISACKHATSLKQVARLRSKQVFTVPGMFLQGQSTVFLISDSQLKDESFLEDINNILNTGEVCLLLLLQSISLRSQPGTAHKSTLHQSQYSTPALRGAAAHRRSWLPVCNRLRATQVGCELQLSTRTPSVSLVAARVQPADCDTAELHVERAYCLPGRCPTCFPRTS